MPRRKPPDRTNNFQPSIFIVNFTGTRVEGRGEERRKLDFCTGFAIIAKKKRASEFLSALSFANVNYPEAVLADY